MHNQRMTYIPAGIKAVQYTMQAALGIAVLGLTAWSAVIVKEHTVRTPLVQAEFVRTQSTQPSPALATPSTTGQAAVAAQAAEDARLEAEIQAKIDSILASAETVEDASVRWFDGRRVRPVRTIWMKVTAYSPDARSCGKWADGQTATMHSVWTNAMRLVAADTRILPYGSIITVPGYADSEIVPVLDCGGAIKGNRLDVLFPTHEIARKWGVRELPITIWAYDDITEANASNDR